MAVTRWVGAAALIGVALSSGCAAKKRAMVPTMASDLNRLQADLDVLPPFPEPMPASGSLWTDGGPGAALVRDTRAFRINDLLTIRLRESSTGTNESTTDLTRDSESNFGAPFVFGLDVTDALTTETQSDFTGDGTTSRSSRLASTVTARVMRVLPNGDLVVAGQKTVMVNRERQVLTLVGSVRPVDIRPDNRVRSSSVGDLTVRLWGKGEVDDTIRQGWFMRIMNRIWPF